MDLLDSLGNAFPHTNLGKERAYDGMLRCLRVMWEMGFISTAGTPARRLVDKDPIVEIKCVKSYDEANVLLWDKWLLLGTSSQEPFEAWLGRPKSVNMPDKEAEKPC